MLVNYFDNNILRRKRKENNFTQEELAERSGLSDRYIRKLENGESKPTAAVLYSLSCALRSPMEDFISTKEVADEEL